MMTDTGWVLSEWRRYQRRRGHAVSTINARASIVRGWIRRVPHWRTATYRDVEAWLDELDVSAKTKRNRVSHLRAFYRWAAREGLTDVDPTALVDAPRVPRTLPRPARDSDVALVLAGASAQLAAMIGLMAAGGLRCCEVAALTWDDVDLAAGSVIVMGKGSKERRIELHPHVVELLARLDTTAGRVFTSSRGRPYTANRVSQIVNRAFRDLGLGTKAHQLRHRAASTAVSLPGADLLAVRDFLGHATVATTQIYTKIADGLAGAISRAVALPAA